MHASRNSFAAASRQSCASRLAAMSALVRKRRCGLVELPAWATGEGSVGGRVEEHREQCEEVEDALDENEDDSGGRSPTAAVGEAEADMCASASRCWMLLRARRETGGGGGPTTRRLGKALTLRLGSIAARNR
jgi:hypothetical protein